MKISINSTEIVSKSSPNSENGHIPPFSAGEESTCRGKRGPYRAFQKADDAVMSMESAKGRLVDVIRHPSMTIEEMLRNVAVALVYLGEGINQVKESEQAIKDYVSNNSGE